MAKNGRKSAQVQRNSTPIDLDAMRAKIIEFCEKTAEKASTPKQLLQAAIDSIEPSIRLVGDKVVKKPSLGTTRLGGQPDFPDDVEWPWEKTKTVAERYVHWNEELGKQDAFPLSLLAQIRLQDVAPYDLAERLPKTGMLWFFMDRIFLSDTSRVIYSEVDDPDLLKRATAPVCLPETAQYKAMPLKPSIELTILPWAGDNNAAEADNDDEFCEDFWEEQLKEKVEAMQGFGPLFSPKHRMFGHPNLIQSPRLAKGTLLLLQIEGEPKKLGLEVGDSGRIHYLTDAKLLKKKNFARGSAFWECC